MVPTRNERDRPADDGTEPTARDGADSLETDGGATPGFDEAALYGVVRKAVEDAILGAIGTLLLVGVSFAIIWVGVTVLLSGQGTLGLAFGAAAFLLGLYLAAATLRIIPPISKWF